MYTRPGKSICIYGRIGRRKNYGEIVKKMYTYSTCIWICGNEYKSYIFTYIFIEREREDHPQIDSEWCQWIRRWMTVHSYSNTCCLCMFAFFHVYFLNIQYSNWYWSIHLCVHSCIYLLVIHLSADLLSFILGCFLLLL